MSLDVTLTHSGEEVFELNVTHNLNNMAIEAGFYEAMWRPDENGMRFAKDVAPYLVSGLSALISDPAKYEAMNPANGWGSYSGFLKVVTDYAVACHKWPEAEVRACR